MLAGIPGVRNIHDDVLIGGKDTQSHNETLKKVFDVCRDNNITNLRKGIFFQPEIKFYGLIFSEHGIQ